MWERTWLALIACGLLVALFVVTGMNLGGAIILGAGIVAAAIGGNWFGVKQR